MIILGWRSSVSAGETEINLVVVSYVSCWWFIHSPGSVYWVLSQQAFNWTHQVLDLERFISHPMYRWFCELFVPIIRTLFVMIFQLEVSPSHEMASFIPKELATILAGEHHFAKIEIKVTSRSRASQGPIVNVRLSIG